MLILYMVVIEVGRVGCGVHRCHHREPFASPCAL